MNGMHYHQHGVPAKTNEEAFKWADEYASAYGATRYCGRWGLQIGIEDPYKYDGISYWQCHSCEYTWNRFTGKEEVLESTEWGGVR